MGTSKDALKAFWFLLLGTVFWGFSFLAMKALGLVQQTLLPEGNSWFFSALSLLVRFGISSLLLLAWSVRSFHGVTRLEFEQGLGLGLAGGIGLLFQMDAVHYTDASTAAFLTQCYCLFIPLFVACRKRCWPAKTLSVSCLMVVIGVAVLSKINFREMRLGRGEWEAIAASVFFTGQILWLERPKFSGNNINHVTVIMFAMNLISILPVFFATKPSWSEVFRACNSPSVLLIYAVLTLFCTLLAYTLMNYWQPHIDATRAGLIYCAEPVFASLFALFLPQVFSAFSGIDYANEKLTPNLLLGGGLITAANVLVLFESASRKKQTDLALANKQE